jgi:HlyD family secretion protein
MRDEKPVAVPVRTGISDGSVTELLEGDLRPGDKVITDAVGGSQSGMAATLRRGL